MQTYPNLDKYTMKRSKKITHYIISTISTLVVGIVVFLIYNYRKYFNN